MSFIPALCLACSRVNLVSLADAASKRLSCATCGGYARVVPGCSYGAKDREAFQELSGIVAEGNLTPTEAQSFASQGERALWSGTYPPLIEALCARLPGLLPHQIAAGKNPTAQRRILDKLRTILDALATARRSSGEHPIVLPTTDVARSSRG